MVSITYGTDGRMATASFLQGSSPKTFAWQYLTGSSLPAVMTMPNGMTLEWGYEEKRDLVATMIYKRGTTRVVEREYAYDSLARPVTRRTARQGSTVNDNFTYNSRSELTAATVNGKAYGYSYDNIGNRKTAQEDAAYTANQLNQYTAIRQEDGEEETFIPTYDADGNQTRIKTSTGIWNVTYNAENRPVRFESADGATVIDCTYDYMGRRHTRKVTVNGAVSNYLRYIYRGYLQIAAIDAVSGVFRWFLVWDPTQPTATRPLAIRKDSTWYAYGWDLTKNVTEVFGPAGYIRTTYTYTPYGEATATGDVTQPIQWSSEYADEELGLIYYNYRHYTPADGRWINRDPIAEQGGWNLYAFVESLPVWVIDHYGLEVKEEARPFTMRPKANSNLGYTEIKDTSFIDKDLEIEYDYKKGKDKCRVFVKNIKEPVFVILEYWPSENEKIIGYSKKGILAIIGHEKRRLLVYQKADKTYIKLVINNVKILYAENELLKNAKTKLNNYIQKYYNTAKDYFTRYVIEQQILISQETKEWNKIRGKLNNEVIGIKWTHKVPDPKPAPMPILPDGIGRTGD